MLSLGRRDEFELEEMSFLDADADAGRRLFMGQDGASRACSFCHDNAGANQEDSALNENFDTGTEDLEPPDDEESDDGFGDGTFNTVSLVEAADTPPFFHNNSAATLEDAVRFYTTETFGNSGSGSFGGAFTFGDTDDEQETAIEQVTAFLRAINAIDNARNALAVADDAKRMRDNEDAVEILRAVASGIEDGIQVLNESDLAPDAVAEFEDALNLVDEAIEARNRGQRNSAINELRRTLRGIPELIAVEDVAVADGG
jgi:hypothetical protein